MPWRFMSGGISGITTNEYFFDNLEGVAVVTNVLLTATSPAPTLFTFNLEGGAILESDFGFVHGGGPGTANYDIWVPCFGAEYIGVSQLVAGGAGSYCVSGLYMASAS
jgi:hypothetical protein